MKIAKRSANPVDMQAAFTDGNPAVKDLDIKVALANKGNGANIALHPTANKSAARKLCTLFLNCCTPAKAYNILIHYHNKEIQLATSPSYLILYRSVCVSFKQ